MKKSLCLLLSLLLLAFSFAGCSEGGETNTDTANPDASNAADASPGETEAPEETGESFDLCSFEEYLGICKEGGKIAVIELKEQCDDAKLSRILSAIDLHYDRKKASFISFEYANLIALSKIDATLNLQYLSETKNDPHFTSCLEKKISIDVKQNILTKKLVKEFHAAGLTVNAWTINKKYDLSIARIKGVDYVTTDCFHEKDGKIHA